MIINSLFKDHKIHPLKSLCSFHANNFLDSKAVVKHQITKCDVSALTLIVFTLFLCSFIVPSTECLIAP